MIKGSGLDELVSQAAKEADNPLTILEAGCGRFKHWNYPADASISGLDISESQLEQNSHIQDKHQGDVQTWETDRQWDVVVSVYVIEHVDNPQQAVKNMLSWTKPGGLLVLAVPNALSLKGLVTKFTPFGFHGWFYRNIYRRPHSIFPTVMDWSITPANLRAQLEGHQIIMERFTEESFGRAFNIPYKTLLVLGRVFSLGRWQPGNSNYLLVVRKASA